MSGWKPTSLVAKAWYEAGFLYDPADDYSYSRMNPQQRKLGYAYAYDEYALACSMNIDCEPVFFEYDNKQWMIELWKGQYGFEVGAEIGVYYRDPTDNSTDLAMLDASVGQRPGPDGTVDTEHSLFYICADDQNTLQMSFTLKDKGHSLFYRSAKHWWLTAFRWGVYADPSDLTMEVEIIFPNDDMQKAFKNALHHMGYGEGDGYSSSTKKLYVKFTFSTPKSLQPVKKQEVLDQVNEFNQNAVNEYQQYKADNHIHTNDPNNFSPNAAIYALSVARANGGYAYEVLRNYIGELQAWDRIVGAASELSMFDYGCIVQVVNQTGNKLNKASTKIKQGHWVADRTPPDTIPVSIDDSVAAVFVLRDNLGMHGAEGSVTYEYRDSSGTEIEYLLSFDCPTGLARNSVKSPNKSTDSYFLTSTSGTGDNDWGSKNSVPKHGHPLYIKYYLKK